jgi:hypothetical protein
MLEPEASFSVVVTETEIVLPMIRWFLIIVAGLITLYAAYWGAFLM